MKDLFLKLKSGQRLKLYPLYKDSIYNGNFIWYIVNKYMFISNYSDFIDIEKINDIHRRIQYFGIVEYNGELHLIKFGYKIRNIIDSVIHKVSDFSKKGFILDVIITKEKGFNSYDQCKIYTTDIFGLITQLEIKTDNIDVYFNSINYKKL